ncbi:branched-chain amino acid transport system ATP-binding protein [Amorphus suaedae]
MTAPSNAPPLVSVEGLSKNFDGLRAVDDVSFTIAANTITGIIGPNGSGKSTTVDCMSGFQRPSAGRVHLDGHDITGRTPEAIARAGLIRTFQAVRLYEDMSIRENLLQAARPFQRVGWIGDFFRSGSMREAVEAAEARSDELVAMIGLERYRDAPASILSYGQKKLVALAAALMPRPRVVVLDEPVAGVNPTRIREVEEVILRLHAAGESFIIIEHNVEFVMRLCGRVIVLVQGAKMMEGDPATVQTDERVLEAYLGIRA